MKAALPIIDFHSHILPGADHGSSGISETLRQLEIITSARVDTVVATPHFYPNEISPDSFIEKVNSSAEKIAKLSVQKPDICLGAEVLYCDHLENMNGLEKLCIRGTNVLLLELPMDTWDRELFFSVENLTKKFTVVLAHIDRYISHQSDEIAALIDIGALAQINAYSLTSFFKKKKLAPFIENRKVAALGSDIHGSNKDAYKKFIGAQKRLGPVFDDIMLRSASLLKGAEYLAQNTATAQ